MTDKQRPRVKLMVAAGALLQVPVRDETARALNWAAVIDIDPVHPGGLFRRWLPKGRGRCHFILDGHVALFDALEFAGDRTAWSGNKIRNRWYGVVVAKTEDNVIIEQYDDGTDAAIAARIMRTDRKALARALRVEQEEYAERAWTLDEQINRITQEDDMPGEEPAPPGEAES